MLKENRRSGRDILIQNFAHATGANGFAAFANGEANRLFHRDRGNQLDLNGDVIARHDHFDAIWQLDRPGHISGAEIKLRPVIGKEWGVTAAFLFAQDIHFRLELLVRLNRARLGDDLTALDLFFLRAAQKHPDVVARARFIDKFAEHLDIGRGCFGGGTNADDLDFLHFLEHATLNPTGPDRAATFNVKDVFDWHQEWLIDRPVWYRNVIVNSGDEGEHLFLLIGVAIERLKRAALHGRNFVARKFILRQQVAHFHFHRIEQFGIVHHVHYVQKHDDRGHAHLARQQDVFARLRHWAVRGRNHQDGTVHLRRTGDHVLDVVVVTGAIDVRIVSLFA